MLPHSRILASADGGCAQPARAPTSGRPAVRRDARWHGHGAPLVASTSFRCGGSAGKPRFVGVRVATETSAPPAVSTSSTSTPHASRPSQSPGGPVVGYAALLGVAMLWGSYTPALRYLFLADQWVGEGSQAATRYRPPSVPLCVCLDV